MPYLNNTDFLKVRNAIRHLGALTELHTDEEDAAIEAEALMDKALAGVADPALRERAVDKWASDDLEIDDEGVSTAPAEDGVWVQAWVWLHIPDEDAEPVG